MPGEIALRHPQSPPPDSNRESPDYKSGALPIELGGQLVVVGPANALSLTVECRFDTKACLALPSGFDWNAVDVSRPIRAVHEKDIDVSVVVPGHDPPHVASDADRLELDDPVPKSACLALSTDELSIKIHHKVVALVHAPRDQNRISAANQLVEDGALSPLAYVDGMVAELRLGQS
jgi:hypothetical protein